MLQRFKRIVTQDQDLTNVQDNVQEVLQPFFTVPIYDGIYFDSISLNAGSNRLLHKLGRKYVGFILCNIKPAGGVSPAQYTNNWQSFVPTITGSGSLTWSTSSITTARYRLNGSTCEIQVGVTGTTGGVTNTTLRMDPPIPMNTASSTGNAAYTFAFTIDGGNSNSLVGIDYPNNRFNIFRDTAATNWGLGASRSFWFTTQYEVAPSASLGNAIVEGKIDDPQNAITLVSDSAVTASILVY